MNSAATLKVCNGAMNFKVGKFIPFFNEGHLSQGLFHNFFKSSFSGILFALYVDNNNGLKAGLTLPLIKPCTNARFKITDVSVKSLTII